MIWALVLAYSAWIHGDQAEFKFDDLAKIHGPFKFWVRADVVPGAGCADCPAGPEASYVVPPDQVEQRWPPGAKTVLASFPISAIGGLQHFYFMATTVTADREFYLDSG